MNSNDPNDWYQRVSITADNSRVYFGFVFGGFAVIDNNTTGFLYSIDTSTNTAQFNPLIPYSDDELALSADQSTVTGSEWFTDANLNVRAYESSDERYASDETFVPGEKLSPGGSLLFTHSSKASKSMTPTRVSCLRV